MFSRTLLSIFYHSFYLLFIVFFILLWYLFKDKGKRSLEIIILITVVLFLIWARFVEPNIVLTKNYQINSDKIKNDLKIAVFSDLHLGVYNNELLLKKIVKKINQANPDIIIIPGDFIYYINKNKLFSYFHPLKDLDAPILAVLGNHDYGKNNDYSQALITNLESLGVLVLENKVKQIELKDELIEFIGFEDLWVGEPNYSLLESEENESYLKNFRVVLAHNPDFSYELLNYIKENQDKHYKNIDLMVSGHTHAGQIRLPFLYQHIIPSKYNFEQGIYDVDNFKVLVSPGVGNVILPMRLFNFPEISFIKVLPK